MWLAVGAGGQQGPLVLPHLASTRPDWASSQHTGPKALLLEDTTEAAKCLLRPDSEVILPCSHHILSHRIHTVTTFNACHKTSPESKKWRNGLHFLMGEAAKPHCQGWVHWDVCLVTQLCLTLATP